MSQSSERPAVKGRAAAHSPDGRRRVAALFGLGPELVSSREAS